MKKIFYIALFALTALVMVGCDNNLPFELSVSNISPLRESIVLDLVLDDPSNSLAKSEVKAELVKQGAKDSKTQTVNFSKEDKTAEVTFKNLTPNTTYVIKFTTGFNGKKVNIKVKTSDNLVKESITVTTSNEGIKGSPYLIYNYEEFEKYVRKAPNGYFRLEADITFPDGNNNLPYFTNTGTEGKFTGEFDGNGKTIRNFKVGSVDSEGKISHSSSSKLNYGLFGYIGETGKVFNLTLEGFEVSVSRSTGTSSSSIGNYSLLCGYSVGTIERVTIKNSTLNVKTSNTNTDKFNVGTVVGQLSGKGTITDVTVENTIINVEAKIDANVGGICGTTKDAEKIIKTENNSKVLVPNISIANFIGGEINVNVNSTSTSSEKSVTSVGGILGTNHIAVVDKCKSTGKIKFNSSFTEIDQQVINVGGLLGWNVNDASVLNDSETEMVFDVTSYDAPKSLTINAGLVVGQNGGDDSPARSTVSNCKYTLPANGKNIIRRLSNSTINVNTYFIGKEVASTKNKDNNLTAPVEIYVYERVVNSETQQTEEVENKLQVNSTLRP